MNYSQARTLYPVLIISVSILSKSPVLTIPNNTHQFLLNIINLGKKQTKIYHFKQTICGDNFTAYQKPYYYPLTHFSIMMLDK